ncbi:MAG: hypothetical protein HY898_04710 [Deltaproteobacteria bacterium]|nr:hypothetical protein [Deltaproteobacteria bacterium]
MSDDASEASDSERPSKQERSAEPRPPVSTSPSFARSFPDDPELRELVEAFERGQFALVRERAPKLAESTSNPGVAEAARELRRRLDPDPLAVKLLLAAVALLIFLSAWAYHTAH